MISSKTQNSVCEYLLNLARNEKKLEVIRQILCENQAFEPYASFIRIDRHRRGAITPENLRHFLKDNAVSHSDSLINSTYIAQYDLDQDDKLAYSE
jgi:Ca2+-binding EF-hand superfamily protein